MLVLYAVSSLLAFTTAAPTSTTSAASSTTTSCQAKTFDLPWTLTDITLYKASTEQKDSSSSQSTISFHFCDNNSGLEMETDCSGTVIGGQSEENDGGYVLCDKADVGFKMSDNLIMVTRAFLDDCLGPAPYNAGRAFGQNNTSLASKTERSGILWSQTSLEVPITSMT